MGYASYARVTVQAVSTAVVSQRHRQTSLLQAVDSFEVGAKTSFLDGAGIFNVAAFYSSIRISRKGYAGHSSRFPNPQETVTKNAAGATIKV